MSKGIIYCTTNLINGRKYIGQTTHPLEKRIRQHYNGKQLISIKIKSYGPENFKWDVLCKCDTRQELDEKEKYYIKNLNSLASENGYNLTEGGEGGDTSKFNPNRDAWIEKLKESKLKNGHYLDKMSPEEKEEWLDKYMRGENHIHKRSCGSEEEYQKWLDENQRRHNNPTRKGKTEEEFQQWVDDTYRGENHYTKKMTDEEFKEWQRKQSESRTGIKRSKEIIEKISESKRKSTKNKLEYIITCPDETKYYVVGIGHFCKEYSERYNIKILNYRQLISIAKRNKTSYYRGFWCEYFDKYKHKDFEIWRHDYNK